MGYQSDGCWVIKGPAKHINAAWTLCRLNLHAPGSEWNDLKNYYVDDIGYIRLDYQNWKWYEGYPEVKFFNAIWTLLAEYADENPDTIYGKRIRIGEDDEDVEKDSFGENHEYVELYFGRSIRDDEPTEGHAFKHHDETTR